MTKKDPVPQEEIEHPGREERKEKEKEKESEKVKGNEKEEGFTEVKNANASGMGSLGKEVEE
jgi:hypothetical protein